MLMSADALFDDEKEEEAKTSVGGRHRVDPRPTSAAQRRKEGRHKMMPPSMPPPDAKPEETFITATPDTAFGLSGALPESSQSRARALAKQREIQMKKRQQSMRPGAMMRGASLPNHQFTPGIAQFSAPRTLHDDPYAPFGSATSENKARTTRRASMPASPSMTATSRDPSHHDHTTPTKGPLFDNTPPPPQQRQQTGHNHNSNKNNNTGARPTTASSVYADDPVRYDRQLTPTQLPQQKQSATVRSPFHCDDDKNRDDDSHKEEKSGYLPEDELDRSFRDDRDEHSLRRASFRNEGEDRSRDDDHSYDRERSGHRRDDDNRRGQDAIEKGDKESWRQHRDDVDDDGEEDDERDSYSSRRGDEKTQGRRRSSDVSDDESVARGGGVDAAPKRAPQQQQQQQPPNVPEFDISALPLDDMRKFLTEPCPRGAGIVQCYVRRNRSGTNKLFPEYTVYLKEGDRFLMCSKKRPNNKTSNYLISMKEHDLRRNSANYIGKLRANFAGTEFQVFDSGWNPKDFDAELEEEGAQMRNELGAVIYTPNVLGSRGPRKMQVAIPKIMDKTKSENSFFKGDILRSMKAHEYANLIYTINKPPRWNEQVGAYVLNFNGRVTMASVKNFQLVQPEEQESIFLQFGRVGKDEFTMDFQWPMTPFQAFAITLSSFDSKIACD